MDTEAQKLLITIICIMFIAGFIGGIANYFRDDGNAEWNWFNIFKSIMLGIVAAAIVPLFLYLVQSKLLNPSTYDENFFNYFVFTGFCLIAAYSSTGFLQSVSASVLKQLEEVKKKTDKIEEQTEETSELVGEVVDKDTGSEENTDEISKEKESDYESSRGDVIKLSNNGLLYKAFTDGKFTFRTLGGLSKATGITKSELEGIMEDCKKRKLVKEFINRDGEAIFSITNKGKIVLKDA